MSEAALPCGRARSEIAAPRATSELSFIREAPALTPLHLRSGDSKRTESRNAEGFSSEFRHASRLPPAATLLRAAGVSPARFTARRTVICEANSGRDAPLTPLHRVRSSWSCLKKRHANFLAFRTKGAPCFGLARIPLLSRCNVAFTRPGQTRATTFSQFGLPVGISELTKKRGKPCR